MLRKTWLVALVLISSGCSCEFFDSGDVDATDSEAKNNADDGLQVINSGAVNIVGGAYTGNGDDDIDV